LTLLTAGPADALASAAPVLRTFAEKILRLGELGTGPLAKALASVFGMLSVAIHTEMLVIAKMAGLDPAGLIDALPLLAPGSGNAPAPLGSEVLTGRYQSPMSSKRLQDDIRRVLDVARQGAAPTMFLSLLQAAGFAAGHSPHATGNALDVAHWMTDNAGVQFGAAT
jgi:3-hydroxyisobutyrate dehydrogenase-like beta-hydroxyacid dehydrogenase